MDSKKYITHSTKKASIQVDSDGDSSQVSESELEFTYDSTSLAKIVHKLKTNIQQMRLK